MAKRIKLTHFDEMIEESKNLAEKDGGMTKRRITSMLEEDDIFALRAIACSQRVSLAWVIRDAVRAYLDKGQVHTSSAAEYHAARPRQ